ncbi:MAG TPA: DUF5682 family protein [Frankiaceae bacterium]|jgi:hypothetical protein|nr:DUF5682 family protein [Frankiaceae bacterium]
MSVTYVGVRHHSPACARLVRDHIREHEPRHVLIEGPADMNDRLDELLLGHELPVAVFTSYRDADRYHASWTPFCEHSPEWVALTEGRRHGAEVRFIDLPAWHEAFRDRSNRYADAERRHADAVERLCEAFGVDDVDALWDHLFEIDEDPDPSARLEAYFDLIRGDDPAGEDEAREEYMASWVAAAAVTGEPVLVVTGGFHRPALVRSRQRRKTWPAVPALPADAVGGSYLVPFSFRRLDAFDGYQSGMPSPGYYQHVWDEGVEAAGDGIVVAVAERLRRRKQPVSTADLVAATTLSLGLARVRGHSAPGRIDVLDGLVSALVTDALDERLPWSRRGPLRAGTDPVVVEMVAALSGDQVGRLHPATPQPPLVHDVAAELERHGLPEHGTVTLDLTDEARRAASRVLHRLRVVGVDGVVRDAGPAPDGRVVLEERWTLTRTDAWLASVIEAGSYGATLEDAAGAALGDRLGAVRHEADELAALLFDATLCGLPGLSATLLDRIRDVLATLPDIAGLGRLLLTVLGLWRHDRLLGSAGSAGFAYVVDAALLRILWLVEGVRGGGRAAPADDGRLLAMVAVRDAVIHAEPILSVDRTTVLDLAARCTVNDRPPDLRGAAIGLLWALDERRDGLVEDVRRAVRAAARPDTIGDFLAGVFAVSREQVVGGDPDVLHLLDDVLQAFDDTEFLVALPALRLAFSWFPPREREQIAALLLARRGIAGSAAQLLRLTVDAHVTARAHAVEGRVDDLLAREALVAPHG